MIVAMTSDGKRLTPLVRGELLLCASDGSGFLYGDWASSSEFQVSTSRIYDLNTRTSRPIRIKLCPESEDKATPISLTSKALIVQDMHETITAQGKHRMHDVFIVHDLRTGKNREIPVPSPVVTRCVSPRLTQYVERRWNHHIPWMYDRLYLRRMPRETVNELSAP